MMKKRVISGVMSAVLGLSLLTGCQSGESTSTPPATAAESKTEATTDVTAKEAESDSSSGYQIPDNWDISEPVNLKIYCIGDEGGIYADDMLDNMNRILTEKINVTIEPVMVSWGEYRQKLPMVWAGGESYDLTFTANWTGYNTEASKGPFYDMTELLPVYAPKTYQELSERGVWEDCEIDGTVYMVPSIIEEWTTHFYIYREDLRKKYNCPEITDIATLETFMDTIKEKEPNLLPLNQEGPQVMLWWMFLYGQDWARPLDSATGTGVLSYDLTEGKKVFNVIDTPEYKDFIVQMREWYEKGYWSQSVMAETTPILDRFYAGKTAVCLDNLNGANNIYIKSAANNPDWEIGILDAENGSALEATPPNNGGMAIGANSKNPERAMMFLELCHQDEEVYNAILYGIEGVTYIDNKDMTTSIPQDKDPSTLGGRNIGMGVNDYKFYKGKKEDWTLLNDVKEDFKSRSVLPALAGFTLNQDSISAEIAALSSVCAEYKLPLEKGLVDPETGIAQLQQKLKDAGIDKVMDEINRQIEAYWASRS